MSQNTALAAMNAGSYFTANNLVTGVATAAAPTSFSDTAPFFTIQNNNQNQGRSIYLDFIRGYVTATGAGGLSVALKLELDHITPTGGTLLVPVSSNTNDGATSGAAIRLLPTGIAVTGNVRYPVGTQLAVPTQTALMGVYTEFYLKFGTDGMPQSTQLGTVAAGITRTTTPMPPVTIGPGWTLQVCHLIASQSAASSWSIEFGYVEL